MKKIVVGLQHRVLTRQARRSFLKLRKDASIIQVYIKRFCAIKMVNDLHDLKHAIETGYMQVNMNLSNLN